MMEDTFLLLRFKCGSRDALCRIYQKYKNTLLKLALALANDVSVAEDVVHDVFVVFAQSAERIGLEGSLRGYLATCVANRMRNINKKQQRERQGDLDQTEPTANQPGPHQWIIRHERTEILNQALAQLPYEQREVILLHLQGDMTFRHIAEIQCSSINTTQSRYRYGIEKLRSLLDHEVQ